MKPEQEFDKIVKQRIDESESEFAFDESNWQKASMLIDAERGAVGFRNNKKYLLAAALILIVSSLGFFSYKYVNSAGQDISEGGLNTESNNTNVSNHSFVQNNTTEPPTEKTIADRGNETAIQKSINDNITTSNETISGEKKESNVSAVVNETLSQKKAEISAVNKNEVAETNHHVIAAARKNKAASATEKSAGANAIYLSNNAGTETQVAENVIAGSNMYENLFLNTKITGMPPHNIDEEIRKTSYDFIRIYKNEDFYTRKRKTYYLDAEPGGAFMLGWDAPKGKDAKGFNAYAGLNFGFHVKKKISATIGAQVYSIGNIQQPFYTGSSVNYDFGANGTYTTIATNTLLYFALPVKLNYSIDKRNTIGVGVNTAVLFNGQNTIETFSMADGVKSNVVSTHQSGYYEGTNSINTMVTAFYSRAVTRRVKLNAEVMYGISDVYENTADNAVKENNIGVRLGLQYTLLSK